VAAQWSMELEQLTAGPYKEGFPKSRNRTEWQWLKGY